MRKIKFEEQKSTKPGVWFSFVAFDGAREVAQFETQIERGYTLDTGDFEPVYTLYRLIVVKGFRRRGIGRRIISYCEARAKKAGLKKLVCLVQPLDQETSKDNIVAFYQQAGFRFKYDSGNTYAVKDL